MTILIGWSGQRGGGSSLFAASAFVDVEGVVGALDEVFERFAGFEIGPAGRKGDGERLSVPVRLDAGQAAEDVADLFGLALRQHGQKLIATKTDGHVGTANGFLQALGEGLDDFVAGGVAKHVVHVFQAIEIQEQQGERARVALGAGNFFGEALFPGTAVVEAGEGVEHGDLVDLLGADFDLAHGLELIAQAVLNAINLQLLINGVDVEEQNESHKTAHGYVQLRGIGNVLRREQAGKGKGSNAQRQENGHQEGGGPQPPLALRDAAQVGADLLRRGKRVRRGDLGLRISHETSESIPSI